MTTAAQTTTATTPPAPYQEGKRLCGPLFHSNLIELIDLDDESSVFTYADSRPRIDEWGDVIGHKVEVSIRSRRAGDNARDMMRVTAWDDFTADAEQRTMFIEIEIVDWTGEARPAKKWGIGLSADASRQDIERARKEILYAAFDVQDILIRAGLIQDRDY